MQAKQQLSEILSAFEFIDLRAYDLAVKHGQGKALGDEDIGDAECFVLIETSGGKREHDEEVCFPSSLFKNLLLLTSCNSPETHRTPRIPLRI